MQTSWKNLDGTKSISDRKLERILSTGFLHVERDI